MITAVFVIIALIFFAWVIKNSIEIECESRRIDREWAALHKRMEENTRKWYGKE